MTTEIVMAHGVRRVVLEGVRSRLYFYTNETGGRVTEYRRGVSGEVNTVQVKRHHKDKHDHRTARRYLLYKLGKLHSADWRKEVWSMVINDPHFFTPFDSAVRTSATEAYIRNAQKALNRPTVHEVRAGDTIVFIDRHYKVLRVLDDIDNISIWGNRCPRP